MPTPERELRELDDWALLQEVERGNRRAGAIFLDRNSGLMSRFFRNKVPNPEDADELVSETLMACVKAAAGTKTIEGAFRPYLFGVAVKVLHSHLRRQYKRQRELDDFDELCVGEADEATPSIALVKKSETRLLVRALRRIPLKYQMVLEMQFFEEMSGPQISELLGIPLPTVYTYQARGKKRLQEVVTELAENPSLAKSTMMGIQTWAEDVRAHISPSDESA